MQAIYNKNGQTVAWLGSTDLYDTSGVFIGFIKGYGVYNSQSKFCGSLKQSVFRDAEGIVVAFMQGAKNTPVLPALRPEPHEPSRNPKPVLKPVGSVPSIKSYKKQWSKLDWHQFIA